MFEFLQASNYIIWDRDNNKSKTVKHVWWRDVWSNDTKSLIWTKVITRKSQLGSDSDIVQPDLLKRFEYVTSLRECQKSFKPKNQ